MLRAGPDEVAEDETEGPVLAPRVSGRRSRRPTEGASSSREGLDAGVGAGQDFELRVWWERCQPKRAGPRTCDHGRSGLVVFQSVSSRPSRSLFQSE